MFTLSLLAVLFVVPLVAGIGAGIWTIRMRETSSSRRH
jgi:hypothetical protein